MPRYTGRIEAIPIEVRPGSESITARRRLWRMRPFKFPAGTAVCTAAAAAAAVTIATGSVWHRRKGSLRSLF